MVVYFIKMNQKFQMVNPHFPLFGTLCSRVHLFGKILVNELQSGSNQTGYIAEYFRVDRFQSREF